MGDSPYFYVEIFEVYSSFQNLSSIFQYGAQFENILQKTLYFMAVSGRKCHFKAFLIVVICRKCNRLAARATISRQFHFHGRNGLVTL